MDQASAKLVEAIKAASVVQQATDELYKTKDISSIMRDGSVYKREILAESVVSLRESLSNLLVEITDFTKKMNVLL